jgi:glycosyltransferase involved in cell wall biosynthesis
MDALKIALASDWFYPKIGGIETHIHELALNLLKLGFEPHVITHDYRFLGKYDDSTLPYPVHRIKGSIYSREHHASIGPATFSKLNELMKIYRFDLTHIHSIYSPLGILAANVSRGLRGIPVVATNHSFFAWDNKFTVKLLPLIRYALQRVDVIISVSTPVADDTRRVLGSRLSRRIPIVVIPNAVDTSFWRPPEPEERRQARRELGLSDSEFVVLSIGRLTRRKRIHAAPKIAALASRKAKRRLTLLLVGDGPLRSVVKRAVDIYSSTADGLRVVWKGFIERRRLRFFYWAADIVLIPGLQEAMPITALEAMACGRPVVGFKGTGLEDVATNSLTQLLASSDEDAASIIARLSADSDTLAKLSYESALQASRRFEWSVVIRRIVNVYRFAMDYSQLEDKRYIFYRAWLKLSSLLK